MKLNLHDVQQQQQDGLLTVSHLNTSEISVWCRYF